MLRNLFRPLMFTPLLLIALLLGGCGDSTPTPVPATPTTSSSIPANLAGTRWRLVSYGPAANPTAALPQTDVTLEFTQPNRIGGSSGCNSYSTTVLIDGQNVQIGSVTSTMMGCVDQAVTAQEAAFLAALQGAQTIEVDGSTLTITYPAGELRFSQQ